MGQGAMKDSEEKYLPDMDRFQMKVALQAIAVMQLYTVVHGTERIPTARTVFGILEKSGRIHSLAKKALKKNLRESGKVIIYLKECMTADQIRDLGVESLLSG